MQDGRGAIRTPDQRLRVFISSTIGELAQERDAVDAAVRSLRLTPVRFELGARPHRPDDLYRAYLEQSDVFVGIYWQSYGWIGPDADVSGIEDELDRSAGMPRLIYVKEPAPEREAGLRTLLERIRDEGGATYRQFASSGELAELVLDDLAVLLSERFAAGEPTSPSLPEGTVSFLFIDLDDSTRLASDLGESYADVLATFRDLVARATEENRGSLVDTQGDGSFCVFPTVDGAALTAVAVQRSLADRAWPAGATVSARMGIHTGVAARALSGYVGIEVHRAARIGAAANGGQILVSRTAAELLGRPRLEGGHVVDLGSYALNGLDRAEQLFQLLAPGLPAERLEPRARGMRVVRLPPELTHLVGRAREVEDVAALLEHDDVRLVTLTGPGGIGKSRLGGATAARLADRYPDGVFFVPLADIRVAEEVAAEVATALEITGAGSRSPADSVIDHLAARRVLLLLDNFEQILEARPTVASLLESCPGVDLLVTSRIPLRIRGEREYAVPPLGVPPLGEDAAGTEAAAAVELFLDRARAARSNWEPNPNELGSIAEICRRLDGLPLAIELAAARLRVLDPAALLARLDRKLDVVGGSVPDLPARQQTLTSTIEWSVDLLEDADRVLLGRLTVLRGGWTVEAAEAVCEDDRVPDVLDGLERLAEHSLVITETGTAGTRRMRMLQTIEEFAATHLRETEELDLLRERQARYFERFLRELHEDAHGEIGWEATLRLDDDWDGIAALMSWRSQRREYATLVRAASLIWRYIWIRGRFRDGLAWLADAYEARHELEPALRGELCRLWAGASQGDHDQAREAGEEAVALLAEWGPPDRAAWARTVLSGVLVHYDTDLARPHVEISRAVETFRTERDGFGYASSLAMQGVISALLGRSNDAAAQLDEAIASAERLGLPPVISSNHTLKAFGCLVAGDVAGARRSLEAAETGSLPLQAAAHWLDAFALASEADGDAVRAATACGAAERLRARTGIERWPIIQLIVGDRLDAVADEPPEVAAARFAGSQMSLETAFAELLFPSPTQPL